MAPAEGLPPATRKALFDDAVRLTSEAKYLCAGTVEFLVDREGRHYFIEVRRCMVDRRKGCVVFGAWDVDVRVHTHIHWPDLPKTLPMSPAQNHCR